MKLSMLILAVISFWSALFGYEVKMRVSDDQDQAVPDADATIAFIGYTQGSGATSRGKTDKNGEFQATGLAKDSVFLVAAKSGYYEARVGSLPNDKDIDFKVVLPRILKPQALYAKDTIAKFPLQNEWLGFDFEVGDWVTPHGKGKTPDIQFKFKNEFLGYVDGIKDLNEEIAISKRVYATRKEEWTEEKFKRAAGKWDAELEISFPGDKEGLHEETRFLTYSQLKLPHAAPEDGFVSTWRYTANTYTPRTSRENVGFFLRTRVKLDKNGNILSANYTKVKGDFRLDARGSFSFSYYFNPTANDRNLEWDPGKNLLQGLNNEETPRDP